jgi:exodeoxyribonuclease VII large subunit
MRNLMATRAAQVAEASAKIPHPRVVLKNSEQRYAACVERLPRVAERWLADAKRQIDQAWRLFDSLSYKKVLQRGYAVVYDGGGRHVARAATAGPGVDLTVEFHDGKVAVRTEGGEARQAPAPARPQRPARRAPANGKQGELL